MRGLDRPTAMRIFDGILHYARTGGGNVEPLHGGMAGSFRLRTGDYRVVFALTRTPCASSAFAIARKPTAGPLKTNGCGSFGFSDFVGHGVFRGCEGGLRV